MNRSLKLYFIDDKYVDYLRMFDDKVFYNKNTTRPYVGVVYVFNKHNYFAPLSSPKPKHMKMNSKAIDIFKINNGRQGIVNINNMIPTPKECLTEAIANTVNPIYRNLLITQTSFLNSNRFKNELHAKYADASIWTWDSNVVEEVLNNKLNYIVINWYEEYEFKSNRALIRDSNYDFKLFIETTHSEIKVYKDIKEKFFAKNIKDDDKVIIEYFKILNIFDNVLNNNE